MPATRHALIGNVDATEAVSAVDASYLQTLLGYNARRVPLLAIELFTQRMELFSMTPVDFSVLSLIRHNPGITSRQLCATLGLLPPNLVSKISTMEQRNLLLRKPHPDDGRAICLYLTSAGSNMVADAEREAAALETEVASKLTAVESKTLLRLLQKVYL